MNSLLELSSTFVIVLANHSGTPMSKTRPPFAFLLTTCATHVSDFVSDDVLHWSNISGNNHAFADRLNVSRATTSSSSHSTLSPTVNMLDSQSAPRKCPLGSATPTNSISRFDDLRRSQLASSTSPKLLHSIVTYNQKPKNLKYHPSVSSGDVFSQRQAKTSLDRHCLWIDPFL